MQIVVSDEVGAVLRSLSTALDMTVDQLLRRFVGLERPPVPVPAAPSPSQAAGNGNFRTREASLPVGLRLRKVFKGQERLANIGQDGIRVQGIDSLFLSPSLAAVAVTGYNTNGWVFWDYWDEKTHNWRPLDDLRRDSMRSASAGYAIAVFNSSFGAELGICQESKEGPSRHPALYVVSNTAWRRPRAFCREHLENVADEDPNLRAAWDLFKDDTRRANDAFHSS